MGVFPHEPADRSTPENHFERSWSNTLVWRVLDQLRDEYGNRGKAALFAGLQPFLTGEPQAGDYGQLAVQLAAESGTLKVALHRMRRRFGRLAKPGAQSSNVSSRKTAGRTSAERDQVASRTSDVQVWSFEATWIREFIFT